MFEEYEKQKKKQVSSMRSIMDYGMGIFVLIVGIFFLIRGKLNIPFNKKYPPDEMDIIIGIVCLLYGIWRLYRGAKKNYYK